MHVDETIGIGPGGLPEGKAAAFKPKRREETVDAEPAPGDPQIHYLHETYLPLAAAVEEVNQQAVAEARQLLQSGQLDSQEALHHAAEAIITFGP